MTGEEILDFLERVERHRTPLYRRLITENLLVPLRNILKVDREYSKIYPSALKSTPETVKRFHQLLLEEKMRDLC